MCSYKGLKHRGDPSSYITSLNTIENGMARITSCVPSYLPLFVHPVSERDKARVSFPDYVTAMRRMDLSSSSSAELQHHSNGAPDSAASSSPSKPQRTAPPYLQPYLRSFDLQKCPALAGTDS
jgi:hypothetical protein